MAVNVPTNSNISPMEYRPTTSSKFVLSRVGPMGTIRARNPANFQTVFARAGTFRAWSGSLPAVEMYEAGFIYRNVRDQVQCVSCFVAIEGWKWYHTAIAEHQNHSPNCRFVMEHNANQQPQNSNLLDMTESQLLSDARAMFNSIIGSLPFRAALSEFSATDYLTATEDHPAIVPDEISQSTAVLASESASESPSESASESTSGPLHGEEKSELPTNETSLCKICYNDEMCMLFLPCAHLLSCSSCANRLDFCALCREPIQHTVRTFISFR